MSWIVLNHRLERPGDVNLKGFKCPDSSDLAPTISTMGSSKQLSRKLKLKIVDAHKAGEGYKKIAKRFQMPISSVRNVIKKWQSSGTVEVKARSGRPRKISDRTARRIVRKASQNPRLTARSLQKDLADTGVVVHYSTIKRYLYKYGLHGRVIRRKPLLRPHHKNQRLNFANEHIDKPDAFWKQVLWTDEVKIELFGRNEQRYVWRRKGTEFNEKNLCPTVKHGGGSIMLWGCIAASGTGNISRVEGKMDSIKFQQILEGNLMPSVKKLKLKRGWLLQMDNDPKHTSKSTVDYIKRRKLKVLPWPSQSPDLNIIENLWIDLKRAVRDRQPRNLKELEDFCKEEWAKIPQTRIERLLAGYKKRLQAVILAKGGSTRY